MLIIEVYTYIRTSYFPAAGLPSSRRSSQAITYFLQRTIHLLTRLLFVGTIRLLAGRHRLFAPLQARVCACEREFLKVYTTTRDRSVALKLYFSRDSRREEE